MNLPRLLIIDDLYGQNPSERKRFCDHLGIWDMARGNPAEEIYLATAHFCSGQKKLEGKRKTIVSNQIELVIDTLRSGWSEDIEDHWSLVLVDFEFISGELKSGSDVPRGQDGDTDFGVEIVKKIAENFPAVNSAGRRTIEPTDVPLIMFSSYEQEVVEPLTDPSGSRAFFKRPANWDSESSISDRKKLAELLFRHALVKDGELSRVGEKGEIVKIRKQPKIIGNSLSLLKSLRAARSASTKTGVNFVFFNGESGAGKELIVNYAHEHSRREQKLLSTDFTTINDNLIESALFGYDKGAFTGQNRDGISGLLEAAGNGSLFIDEIGNCPGEVLKKLLRLISSGTFIKSGQNKSVKVNCQIFCATNKPLEEWCPPELLNRGKGFIYLPSLAERRKDIRGLYDYFVERECKKLKCGSKLTGQEVYDWLESHSWSVGNIRELEHAVEYAVNERTDSGTIQLYNLQKFFEDIKNLRNQSSSIAPQINASEEVILDFEELLKEMRQFTFRDNEVNEALPKLNDAIGSVIANMIETAYRRDSNFTRCFKIILEEKKSLATSDVKNIFKKLVKNPEFDLESKSATVKKFKEVHFKNGGAE